MEIKKITEEYKEKGRKITKVQALRTLSNCNELLFNSLRENKRCTCGSCYLCAFHKIAGKTKWKIE